jgi:hypothetical protein
MKAYVIVDIELQLFLTSELEESENSSLRPSRFLPEETALAIRHFPLKMQTTSFAYILIQLPTRCG